MVEIAGFKKFIPILRRMFDAGWQPITHARVQGSAARVERYGSAAGGEVLLAVYNPTSAPLAIQLRIDTAALQLADRQSPASAMVSGAALACRRQGDKIGLTVPLGAKKCEVVRLGR